MIVNTSNDPTSVTGNLVEGNFIGTKASGKVDLSGYPEPFLSNLQGGVAIISADGNTIGGTDPNAFNLISGNEGPGVLLSFGALHNLVEGNLIGPDLTGLQYIGNTGSGLTLDSGALNNTIGGTTPRPATSSRAMGGPESRSFAWRTIT